MIIRLGSIYWFVISFLFRQPITESVGTEYAEKYRQAEAQELDIVENDQLVCKPGKKMYIVGSYYKLRYSCPFPPCGLSSHLLL